MTKGQLKVIEAENLKLREQVAVLSLALDDRNRHIHYLTKKIGILNKSLNEATDRTPVRYRELYEEARHLYAILLEQDRSLLPGVAAGRILRDWESSGKTRLPSQKRLKEQLRPVYDSANDDDYWREISQIAQKMLDDPSRNPTASAYILIN